LENTEVLWTLIIILLVSWALGFGVWGSTVGPVVHLLLLLAVVVFIIDLVRGRRDLSGT
jgi:uncharacterized membrane protein YtjA (UPF0391 family)